VSPEAYARILKALLPPSKMWRLLATSVLSKLFIACGDELSRVDARVLDLIRESDPRTADEVLPDFERVLELAPDGTADARRARVVARLLRRQRFRPVDFLNALRPLLAGNGGAEDPILIERGRAFAVLVDDDREIFRFFILRDPEEPGTYDLPAAQALVNRMQPSHTAGYVIESINMLCNDVHGLCDRDLLGI
jgi:hypothetical protein